jgi:peptide/nickel transport system substrate-binding protein
VKTPLRDQLIDSIKSGRMDRREVLRLSALLGLGAGAAACAPTGGGPQTLRIATIVTDVKDVHANSAGGFSLCSPVMDFLCTVDARGVAQPALMERWSASDDLRTWTFNLRRDARWRKGGPLTADQVLWNWRRWVDPKVGSAYLGYVTAYLLKREIHNRKPGDKGPRETWVPWDANMLEKVDDYTIRVNLKEPSVTVAEDLFNASGLIADPEEDGQFHAGCNGTGPFEVVEYRVDDISVYRAREGSWRGRPRVDKLEFVHTGGDQAVIAAGLISNQIQGVLTMSPENALLFKDSPDIRLYSIPSAATELARVHCDVKPFDDARVRRAMRLAVDPAQAVKLILGGWGTMGQHSHVSPSHPDHGPEVPMGVDIAEARRLMAQAGLAKGFKTKIVASSGIAAAVKAAQVLSQMWSEIGIDCAIQSMPNELYTTHWREFPLSITGWGHRPLAIMTMSLCYRTGSLWNESHYSNPAVDALIDKAQRVLDPRERAPLIGQVQRLLQEDGPLIQPFWIPSTAAFHRSVNGVKPHPMYYYQAEQIGFAA